MMSPHGKEKAFVQEQPKVISKCRVCGGGFHPTPLICFENMPSMAQFFPDDSNLAQDKEEDLEVCQCAACGLVQINCQPVDYHREVVRAVAFSEEMRGFRLAQFTTFVEEHRLKDKKVLEIGCGRGEYLSLMHDCGVIAHGLEASPASCAAMKGQPYTVFEGYIDHESAQVPEAPYDAFYILNFLEHLPDINATLRGIANNLNAGAVGLVEVPNFDMIIRNGLFSEFIRDHLFYFTQDTLVRVLSQNGFEVLDCREVWHDYSLSAVVRKRTPIDLSHFAKFQQKIDQDVRRFIGDSPPEKVAIWGAGHQALAIISLLKLQNQVSCVIDSASFKQGKYTPASHLPIVSPEHLLKHPVDALIVMAGSFSDEVAGVIRANHGSDVKVAILRDYGLEHV